MRDEHIAPIGEPDDGEQRTMVASECGYQSVANAELFKATEGTPEYYRALETFIMVLFPERDSPKAVSPER